MFGNLLLGLLRDERPRHGYELLTDYRQHAGIQLSPGTIYRELARLATNGFVTQTGNADDADARRIPYRITPRGAEAFDRWLLVPGNHDADVTGLLLYFDRVPSDRREDMLRRQEDNLWMRATAMGRMRDDAVQAARTSAKGPHRSLLPIVRRRLKVLEAEMEFLKEFRRERGVASRPVAAADGVQGVRDRTPVRGRPNQARESKS